MFNDIYEDVIIKISNKFTKCREKYLWLIKLLILMKLNVKNLKIVKNALVQKKHLDAKNAELAIY